MEDSGKKALEELLGYFNNKNFDLDVWKIKASIIFKKLFGENDEKIALVSKLNYDFSSWSLRDENGSKHLDSVREQAHGLTEAALVEYELTGKPDSLESVLMNALQAEDYARLSKKFDKNEVSEQMLTKYFSKIAGATKDKLLAQLILNCRK